jgi:hypothetical protein
MITGNSSCRSSCKTSSSSGCMNQQDMMSRRRDFVSYFFLIYMLFLTSTHVSASKTFDKNNNRRLDRILSRTTNNNSVLVGAALEWQQWGFSTENVSKTLGYEPATFVLFTNIPFTDDDLWVMERILPSAGARGQHIILTMEPYRGFDAVREDGVIENVTRILRKYEDEHNVTFILRFAHEMNGSWYPWSQQPRSYIDTFRMLAMAVAQATRYATMMFCPNVGPGYPYVGGEYFIGSSCTSSDCELLDTNKDGKITSDDDMFSPYWPGDDVVDWIGSSLYHWGDAYPWGENVIPPKDFFFRALTSSSDDKNGGLYRVYSEGKGKPMIVTETAALYNQCDVRPGTGTCQANTKHGWLHARREYEIKSAWWEQVFSMKTLRELPNIRIISWFNVKKRESEVQWNTVDWTMYSTRNIKRGFLNHLSTIMQS